MNDNRAGVNTVRMRLGKLRVPTVISGWMNSLSGKRTAVKQLAVVTRTRVRAGFL